MEAASERVVIYRDGVRGELSLFAIPIITTFEQNVPESQFESAVSGFDGLRGLAPKMKDGKVMPPHKDWVKNVFLRRWERALVRQTKLLERLRGRPKQRGSHGNRPVAKSNRQDTQDDR